MRRWWLVILYAATLATVAALAAHGRRYYLLPIAARPRDSLHWQLKPGGTLGQLYGVVGLSMMIAMLSYSVRKRLPFLRRVGRLGTWLDVHIYFGVAGPLFIVLHSALKVGGIIAIAFWSMVAVALSGILGRFLYAQLPRSAAGDELSLEDARRLEAGLTERLRDEFALDERELAALAPVRDLRRRSLAATLLALLTAPLAFRRTAARFRRTHRQVPAPVAAELVRVARQRSLLRRRLELWRRLHELFHYWHVFHKPFAILMYLFAAIHVGVAWATGYLGGYG